MRRSVVQSWLVSIAAGGLALGGGMAYAGTISQGSDYSFTKESDRRAVICDQEADSRHAYVQYGVPGGDGWVRINDQDGAGGSCWQNASLEWNIYRHRTCEPINNWPDACSEYHYE